jgi:hydrogenase maturation protease
MIVIGIGNPDRGDDGAGRMAALRLRAILPPAVAVAECDGDVAGLVDLFDGFSNVILVDACASGAPAGKVHRLEVSEAPLPTAAFNMSSHGFGLAEAIELARALGQLPPRCMVYAIEGETFETGAGLSGVVDRAIDRVVREIVRTASESV